MAHWVQELKKAMTEKTAFVAGVETSTELAPTASIRTLRASERHKKQRMSCSRRADCGLLPAAIRRRRRARFSSTCTTVGRRSRTRPHRRAA
jgi:hypothetical protein